MRAICLYLEITRPGGVPIIMPSQFSGILVKHMIKQYRARCGEAVEQWTSLSMSPRH